MSSRKSKDSKCIQCGTLDSKYKCPKCFCKYCSVKCCKQHKESCTQVAVITKNDDVINEGDMQPHIAQNPEINQVNEIEIEDKVSLEKLELLEQSATIRRHLENPHLRKMLQNLDSSKKKTDEIKKAMQEPIFTEFADACLGIVDKDN